MFTIEVGRYSGKYKLRWSTDNESQAFLLYRGLNTFAGYKKRLKKNGKVIARYISSRYDG